MPTEPRRRAYQLEDDILAFLNALGPSTGYEMVRRLDGPERRISPAMVYRSLSRLIAAKRVMRVELLKVFMVTPSAPSVTLICSTCSSIALLPCPAMLESFSQNVRAKRFTIDRLVVELLGLCPKCRVAEDSGASGGADCRSDLALTSELLDTV